ncbi:MAG: hypothetical protein M5U34_43050 [Chloroflexi bacterium]|nr:hypothetical protein [Chloroflexota bacterium]
MGAVISALLVGFAELAVQQPAIIGWLLVILGIVSVWGGVSRSIDFPTQFQATPIIWEKQTIEKKTSTRFITRFTDNGRSHEFCFGGAAVPRRPNRGRR